MPARRRRYVYRRYTTMKDSTKSMSKMLGTDRAETAAHAYVYWRYIAHYIYHMGKNTGFIQKRPEEEVPPEIEEIIEIYANRVMREILTVETSTYPVSYTHLRAHETRHDLVCRLLLEKKKK